MYGAYKRFWPTLGIHWTQQFYSSVLNFILCTQFHFPAFILLALSFSLHFHSACTFILLALSFSLQFHSPVISFILLYSIPFSLQFYSPVLNLILLYSTAFSCTQFHSPVLRVLDPPALWICRPAWTGILHCAPAPPWEIPARTHQNMHTLDMHTLNMHTLNM